MIYIACFALSALFAWLANNKAKNKIWFYVFSAISIAVVVLLAGLRDFSIGIDTENYMTKKLYWDGAIKSATLVDYIYDYIITGYGEPFFALLIGIVAQFTGDFSFFLTIAHGIIITCIYVGAFRLRKHINPEWVLIIFYFLFFNHSLNGIRQYVAMAIIFAFLADLVQEKVLRFCIVVFCAMLFHTTALIAAGFLIIYFVIYPPKPLKILNKISLFKRKVIFSAILSFAVLGFPLIIKLAVKLGLLNKRYLFIFEGKIEPAAIVMGMVALELFCVYYFSKEIRLKSELYDFFTLCSICYFILLFLTFIVSYGKRISLYFGMADIVTLALIENAQTDKKKKWLVRTGILGMVFVYWFYVYVFRNASATMPYSFVF